MLNLVRNAHRLSLRTAQNLCKLGHVCASSSSAVSNSLDSVNQSVKRLYRDCTTGVDFDDFVKRYKLLDKDATESDSLESYRIQLFSNVTRFHMWIVFTRLSQMNEKDYKVIRNAVVERMYMDMQERLLAMFGEKDFRKNRTGQMRLLEQQVNASLMLLDYGYMSSDLTFAACISYALHAGNRREEHLPPMNDLVDYARGEVHRLFQMEADDVLANGVLPWRTG